MLAIYTIQTIILIAGLIILLVANRKAPKLFFALMFMLWFFSKTALDMTEEQINFYLFGLLFWMIMTIWLGNKLNTQAESTENNAFRGWAFELYSLFLAFLLYIAASIFTISSKGQIMGTPTLAIGSTESIRSTITLAFAPLMSGSLGFIENGVFLTFLIVLVLKARDVYKVIIEAPMLIPFVNRIYAFILAFIAPFTGLLILVFPFVATAFAFGLFHLVAYSFVVGKIIWASLVMGLMILSYYVSNRDMTAMNEFHFGWNGILTLKEGLTIVG